MAIIEDAMAKGWSMARACGLLELDRRRAWRWQARATAGALADRPPGGNPVHGLLDWEEAAIVELFEEWGPIDLSHRKLAHRGSYTAKVWGVALHAGPSPGPPRLEAQRRHPNRAVRRRNRGRTGPSGVPTSCVLGRLSGLERCTAAKYAYAIIDLVSRKWIATTLAAEATGTQVTVLFLRALEDDGLLGGAVKRHESPVRPTGRCPIRLSD